MVPKGLVIGDFEFDGSFNDKSFNAEIDIHSDLQLTIAGAAFGITEIYMALSYEQKKVVSCAIAGTLTIFSMDVKVLGDYDETEGWIISGGLVPGEVMPVSALISNVISTFSSAAKADIIGSVTVLPQRGCNNIWISYGMNANALSICADLGNVLKIPVLTINQVVAKIDVNDKIITGTCALALTVGGVDLALNGSKTTAGLLFSGGTTPGQQIPAGKLADELFSKFGGAQLPSFISGIVVDSLSISYQSLTADFAFAVTGTITVGASRLPVSFNTIMACQKDGSYSKKINATISGNTSLPDLAQGFGFSTGDIPSFFNGFIFKGLSFHMIAALGA